MKCILTFFLSIVLLPVSLSGQITRAHNALRVGDKIIKQQVNYVAPGDSGTNILWDLSKLKLINDEYTLEYIEPALVKDSIYIMGRDTFPKEMVDKGELIIGIEHYTAYYYRLTDNRLNLLGFENPVTLMHYQSPLLVMDYPFTYGSENAEFFKTKGLYSQTSPLGTQGEIRVKADATGRIILPAGDTLDHVVRIKTTQSILEIDSFSRQEQSPMKITLESYRWFAQGYRYPIFETVHTLNDNNPDNPEFFKTAFFYPPIEHYYLEEDIANQDIIERENDRQLKSVIAPTERVWTIHGSYWSCRFYPNPVQSKLHIVYSLDKSTAVTLSLYDMGGQLLRTLSIPERNSGYYEETLNCTSLPAGSYVCKMTFGEEKESRIIIKE